MSHEVMRSRNPAHPEALVREELALNMGIRVISATTGEEVLRGLLIKLPDYDEGKDSGWVGAKICVDGEIKPFYLEDNGVTRSSSGNWSERFTVAEESVTSSQSA